ncbi:MAG: ABC transporter ATP-binding protein, partial [Pseudomonadota bacterium]
VFLSDRTVVFSARPARAQRVVEIDLGGHRTLDDLYTPRAVELLATLRREIQVAQGREVEPDALTPVPGVAGDPRPTPAATSRDPSVGAPR